MEDAPVKFTRLTGKVANVTGMLRLKRLGKIRLGIKKLSTKTNKEYPSETDYFVCPPEVRAVYGEQPKVLEGMFLSNDPHEIYQEKLALYGQTTGLKCHGDGTDALRRNDEGKWERRTCPCEFLKTEENPGGQCGPQAHLMVMLPKVDMWGYYQITTRGINSRVSILEDLQAMQDMLGRISRIPIRLTRKPQDITYKGSSKTHYIVTFKPTMDVDDVRAFLANPANNMLPESFLLDAPVDENPLHDPVDLVVENDDDGELTVEAETLSKLDDTQLAQVQEALKTREAQKAAAPPAEPAKKKEYALKAGKRPSQEEAQWIDVMNAIRDSVELTGLVKAILHDLAIGNMEMLTPQGRPVFLERLKTKAHEDGLPVPY